MPPTYNSPGSYVIEKDFSEFPVAVNSSIAGIVGFAAAGEENKATLVTSAAQLVRTFGTPDVVSGGQGLLAAIEILGRTNAVYYVRAATDKATDASAVLAYGSCPAVYVSGIYGDIETLFSFSSTDQDGTSNTPTADGYVLTVPAGTAGSGSAQVSDAMAKVQTSDFAFSWEQNDPSSGWFVGSHAGSSTTLQVSSNARFQDVKNYVSAMEVIAPTGDHFDLGDGTDRLTTTNVTASGCGVTPASPGGTYFVRSLYSGSNYNFSSVTKASGVTNKGLRVIMASQAGKGFTFTLSKDGATEEAYSLDFEKSGESGNFPENVINVGTDNAVSENIKAEFLDETGVTAEGFTPPTDWKGKLTGSTISVQYAGTGEPIVTDDATPRFMKFIDSTNSLAGGVNGDVGDESGSINADIKAALIGNSAAKTGMYALDRDDLNISMACVPGISEQSVINSLVSLAETSKNFLAVVSPPEGLSSAQDAINWHNGQSTGRTSAINSSYAAIYWPWVKIFDVWTKTDKLIDPAAFAIGTMAHTDAVADPWFAPAGLTRGRLTKPFDVEVNLNQGDRDSLYQPGNAVNPIAKFAQDGIAIWGQRTAQRAPSSLDRINVRRMMIVIRKMILASTRALVFEPNDPLTWNRIVQVLEPALDDIRRRRGITEFQVVCDSTTNTPVRVDRNELWCRVLIKPTKTAEVLIFELNLTNQSADLS